MSSISRPLKLLLLLVLLTACAVPAWSQMPLPPGYAVALPPPAPPGVYPGWTPVPTSPKVLYATNIPADLFLVQKRYYYYYGGVWYQSKYPEGPWGPVTKKLPKDLYRVHRSFFKTPPPW
jgi:hypothetical protein